MLGLRTVTYCTENEGTPLHAARSHNDELGRTHATEREKWEERAAGNERRLLADIDRERQALKRARSELDEAIS